MDRPELTVSHVDNYDESYYTWSFQFGGLFEVKCLHTANSTRADAVYDGDNAIDWFLEKLNKGEL